MREVNQGVLLQTNSVSSLTEALGTNPAEECLSQVLHWGYYFKNNNNTNGDDDNDDNVWKQNSTFPTAASPFPIFFLFLRKDGTYCCSVVCYLFGVLFVVAVLQVNATNTTSVSVSPGQQSTPVHVCWWLQTFIRLPGTDSGFLCNGLERTGLRCSSSSPPCSLALTFLLLWWACNVNRALQETNGQHVTGWRLLLYMKVHLII